MQREVSLAARLGFTIDPPVLDAIASERQRIALAAPARLAEEYFKILRSGAAERTFRELPRLGLLEPLSEVLHAHAGGALSSLGRLDAYRLRSEAPPAALTNGVLLGSLIVPIGFSQAGWPAWMEDEGRPGLNLGVLPLPRRDVERTHQLLMLQRRLREPSRSPHARRILMQRSAFPDALTWLEIHGDAPEQLDYWREHHGGSGAVAEGSTGEARPRRRRRPSIMPGAQRDAWEQAIENAWSNRFKFCCRCCCCRNGYTIDTDLQFVSSGEHQVVTVDDSTTGMLIWDQDQTRDIPHEFGHMLGALDEYFTVNGVDYGADHQATGNIMNHPENNPAAHHYDLIRAAVQDLLDTSCRTIPVVQNC